MGSEKAGKPVRTGESKIAISLPADQLAKVQREIRAGRADSVSDYVARVLAVSGERALARRRGWVLSVLS